MRENLGVPQFGQQTIVVRGTLEQSRRQWRRGNGPSEIVFPQLRQHFCLGTRRNNLQTKTKHGVLINIQWRHKNSFNGQDWNEYFRFLIVILLSGGKSLNYALTLAIKTRNRCDSLAVVSCAAI